MPNTPSTPPQACQHWLESDYPIHNTRIVNCNCESLSQRIRELEQEKQRFIDEPEAVISEWRKEPWRLIHADYLSTALHRAETAERDLDSANESLHRAEKMERELSARIQTAERERDAAKETNK